MKNMNVIIGRMIWILLLALSVAPGFLRGQGSERLSKQDVKTLIGNAKTAEDQWLSAPTHYSGHSQTVMASPENC